MNHKIQQSNLKSVRVSSIAAAVVLGSIATSLFAACSAVAEPTAPRANGSLTKIAASAPLKDALQSQPTAAPANGRIAQASDVAGNWAEPFIRVLVEKQIIAGYPDGTYRPDQPVTRAEFAALLNKAFTLTPVRSGRNFRDVPSGYWAADVIQKAYQSGFLAGYPNGTFAPKQNLTRIQGLVSVVNGSKLEPTGNFDLNSVFGDAAQVPSYGQNALIAATQKCVAVSVDYDNTTKSGNFGPNTVATRADVAAYIHQVLVAAGRLPALDASSPAYKYIATCAKAVAMTPEEAISKLSVPGQLPEIVGAGPAGNYPVGGLGTPTAFTGSNGVFFGAAYQNTTRPNIYGTPPNNPNTATTTPKGPEAWAYTAGINVGDPRNFLGLEAVGTTYTRGNAGSFDNGGISFKLNHQFGDNLAVAGGYENAITFGNNSGNGGFNPDGGVNGGRTGYGVVSYIVNPDPSLGLFSNTTLSVGAGGGRFRQVGDIRRGVDNVNVFGSIGTRLSPNFSLVADWNGQDLGVGLPISLPFFAGSSLQITPALVDLTNSETGGSRFVVSGGLGFQF